MTASGLSGVRASNLVTCLRKGWYDSVEAEQEELDRDVRALFRIRQMENDALAALDAEEARAAGREIVLELAIPWGPVDERNPHGVWEAHADYADMTDHMIVEYTGSANLSPDRRKMLQAAFYAKRMSEITGYEWTAWVKVFDPSTGADRLLQINWQEMVWEVDVLIADLMAYLAAGEEPPRRNSQGETVCASPIDGRFCPYAGWCFRTFEYPPIGLINDATLAAEVVRVRDLTDRADVKLIEADLKPLKKRVAAQLQPKAKYVVPLEGGAGIEVSYSEIPGRVTISLAEMRDAGYSLPPELEQFVKRGEASVRLNTKRIEAQ